MAYIVLDPVSNYCSAIIEFLGRYERQAIAIFTSEKYYHGFHHIFAESLGSYFIDEYLLAEFPSVEALANRIRIDWPEPLEGIVPWDEMTIEIGARVGEALGLDWNSPEVIHRFRNKWDMKSWLREQSSVRINASRLAGNEEEALEFQAQLGRWPIVVKPTEGAGSQNVYFVRDIEELILRGAEVFRRGGGQVLLEEYVGGDEFVVNGIVDAERRMLVTDVWFYDKRESHGIENLYYETIKVNTYDPVFWPLAKYAGQVVEDLGLRRAPVHVELKLDELGPCLIEVGARFAGGNQPMLASALHERSLFELAACHYMAELPLSIDDLSYEKYDRLQARIISGIQPKNLPHISGVHGIDEVQALPSFFDVGFIKPPGLPLPKTRDMDTKSYEIYLLHANPDQIAHDARQVRELLHYF